MRENIFEIPSVIVKESIRSYNISYELSDDSLKTIQNCFCQNNQSHGEGLIIIKKKKDNRRKKDKTNRRKKKKEKTNRKKMIKKTKNTKNK